LRIVGATAKKKAACDVNGAALGGLLLSGATTFVAPP